MPPAEASRHRSAHLSRFLCFGVGIVLVFPCCGCSEEDVASGDARRIALEVHNGSLYWAGLQSSGRYSIKTAKLDGSHSQDVLPDHETELHRLAIDPSGGRLYVGNSRGISCMRFDGSGKETLVEATRDGGIGDFALDVGACKMYWVEYRRNGTGGTNIFTIERADLNGSRVETVNSQPHPVVSLALDTSAGYLYWYLRWSRRWTRPTRSTKNFVINRQSLKGGDVQRVHFWFQYAYYWLPFSTGALRIALDVSGSRIYWIDELFGIRRARLNGSEVEDFIKARDVRDLALDTRGGRIYWVDGESSKIRCADLVLVQGSSEGARRVLSSDSSGDASGDSNEVLGVIYFVLALVLCCIWCVCCLVVDAQRSRVSPESGAQPVGRSSVTPNIKTLYHATDAESARSIANSGFMLRGSRNCMFGSGIYFAATAEVATAKAWHGSATEGLIRANVALGRCFQVQEADNSLNFRKLRRMGYDSVFAGVRPHGPMASVPEWVVYSKDQVQLCSVRVNGVEALPRAPTTIFGLPA